MMDNLRFFLKIWGSMRPHLSTKDMCMFYFCGIVFLSSMTMIVVASSAELGLHHVICWPFVHVSKLFGFKKKKAPVPLPAKTYGVYRHSSPGGLGVDQHDMLPTVPFPMLTRCSTFSYASSNLSSCAGSPGTPSDFPSPLGTSTKPHRAFPPPNCFDSNMSRGTPATPAGYPAYPPAVNAEWYGVNDAQKKASDLCISKSRRASHNGSTHSVSSTLSHSSTASYDAYCHLHSDSPSPPRFSPLGVWNGAPTPNQWWDGCATAHVTVGGAAPWTASTMHQKDCNSRVDRLSHPGYSGQV
eukprot:gene19224-25843_t